MSDITSETKRLKCSHCGEICSDKSFSDGENYFCCAGCKTVYELLNRKNLSRYYSIMETPGISLKEISDKKFEYLDDPEVTAKLLDFDSENISIVTFKIPQMHCSSCIWLLENLRSLNEGVSQSTVNFLRKELEVKFEPSKLNLKNLVKLLTAIGYEPEINLSSIEKKKKSSNKNLYYKIGIAGFCFGNIMLLSFPEYLSPDLKNSFFSQFFGYLNLLLALPVFFYSASEYFGSAFKALKKKIVNIDFPISLGILILFSRSAIEILTHTGAGYFDSMTGLVFLLLLGKLFQQKTYDSLNFERTYKSYFPLSVNIKDGNGEKSVPVSKLKIGDRYFVRKNEIIPADSILFGGEGIIDFSFVTGESRPVSKVLGEMIYAGGKQLGGVIELEVIKEVSQSYLTSLWNNNNSSKSSEGDFSHYANMVSKYFTAVILTIAFAAAAFWMPYGFSKAMNVLTSVLIVACPCALALSIPFTLGNSLRIFGRNKFYLKNIAVIENLSRIKSIVFDKTGTITENSGTRINFIGSKLNTFQEELVKSVTRNSTHPLSKIITEISEAEKFYDPESFEEYPGRGIEGTVLGHKIRLGNLPFTSDKESSGYELKNDSGPDSRVYLSVDGVTLGFYEISNHYRSGVAGLIKKLIRRYEMSLLTGDGSGEKENLKKIFGTNSNIMFYQTPDSKLRYIKDLQSEGKKVLMVGDGLNDAGALSQSSVGIAVSDNISYFTPASDAILDASEIGRLNDFIEFSRTSIKIIYTGFGISFLYNLVGLSFAVDGMLSPLVAAVLMPLSSISVVTFASLSVNLLARKRGL